MAFYDRAWMTTASTGTGTITLGTAVSGFQTFAAAGVANATVVSYTIVDGTSWEIGRGTYYSSGTTLARSPTATSNGNATAIAISASATIFLDVLAADIGGLASLVSTATQTFAGALSAPVVRGSGTTSPATGAGVELQFDGTNGYVFSYDRSAAAYKPLLVSGSVVSLNSGSSGATAVTIDGSGNVGVGVSAPSSKLHVNTSSATTTLATVGNTNGGVQFGVTAAGVSTILTYGSQPITFGTGAFSGSAVEYARFDGSGNLIVGATSASGHRFVKTSTEGTLHTSFDNTVANSLIVNTASAAGYSSNVAAVFVGKNSSTGRSINAGGTINASGADYAEYMTRAEGCGTIAKGDVCGVDAGGHLVTTWADAISFKVKSTDPNIVGGDIWAAHLGDRPVEPVLVLPVYAGAAEPVEPEPVPDDETDAEPYAAAHLAYEADLAEYEAAQAAHATTVANAEALHDAAQAQWQADLNAFEAALEAARQTVDRIAYCGQVPVNFPGTCQPGDYLVAAQNGAGIGLIAIASADMTLPQYMARVGRVLAIRDSRPWIDVQHG